VLRQTLKERGFEMNALPEPVSIFNEPTPVDVLDTLIAALWQCNACTDQWFAVETDGFYGEMKVLIVNAARRLGYIEVVSRVLISMAVDQHLTMREAFRDWDEADGDRREEIMRYYR
jgi:hypothetical protein